MPSTSDAALAENTVKSQPWWRSAVVYQIYPRSFADSDGDGVGDLRGIISRLDYLADLGVDVIWLSPIYPSPQDDNGYDISDYRGVEPTFGTLDDFDELLDGVHRRGMKLVMDLVVNHTSDEHPWFIESRSSANNPKRDWYWWRPARDGMAPGTPGAEPTNWESFFSGSTWKFDELSNEYYLHLFSVKQPDLNWENPDVRAAVYEMMRWWLDRGVDGFRMDVINMISKDTSLPDGSTLHGGLYGDGSASYLCGPRIHEFLQEMHQAVFSGRPDVLLTVGEMPGVTVEDAVLFTDPARQEVDMVFQFEHVSLDSGPGGKWDIQPLKLVDLKASLGRWQAGLAQTGWNSLYWDNHDQPRAVSRFGDDGEFRVQSARMLASVLHLHRGTPYVYQGEELGMTNTPFGGPADFRDIESVNQFAAATAAGDDPDAVLAALRVRSRDNARTPMQWDDSAAAGFSSGAPWIAVNPNYREINAAAQADDPDSVLAHYRAVIDLRHRDPVVAHGDFTMLLPTDDRVYAYTRSWQGSTLLVLGNFSGEQAPAPVPDESVWAAAELVLGNYPAEQLPSGGQAIVLRPWESRIYRRAV
ncbi:MAG: alpha-glucosidase [Nakamurella sp.]